MEQQPWAIVISQNGLSNGGDQSEIHQLLGMLEGVQNPPVKLYFTTEGVSLVAAGSPVLPRLKKLEANGVEMITCRTCLDYLGLRDHDRLDFCWTQPFSTNLYRIVGAAKDIPMAITIR